MLEIVICTGKTSYPLQNNKEHEHTRTSRNVGTATAVEPMRVELGVLPFHTPCRAACGWEGKNLRP